MLNLKKEPSMAVSILLAESHAVFRLGLVSEMGKTPGLYVVGVAVDGEQALQDARALCPNVAVLDIDLPRLSGIDVLVAIRAESLPSKVLILTGEANETGVYAAITSGANGYLLKTASWPQVAKACLTVAAGGTVVDMGTLSSALRHRYDEAPRPILTAREIEVISLSRHETAIVVGAQLHISEGAVRKHLTSIYTKFGVRNKASAVAEAVIHGYIN